jgi:iron complex outermembrane receptor protein
VVVTAQKRTENIQDVPIAVTAVTSAMLEQKGITDVAKLGNLAPNVTLDAGTPFSGSNTVLSAFIRGIGQNDFAFNQDPGVGVYVDGVYLARSVGANTTMMDVDRVEILKGPQGTLFGRNTIGGAISIVTRDPGHDFLAKGEVTTGRFDRIDFKGTADLPIADNVLTSLSFSTAHRKGYQRRIPFPGTYLAEPYTDFPAAGYKTSSTEGGENQWSVRGKLIFLATDKIKLTVTADYTDVDQSALPNTVLGINPAPGLAGLYNACLAGVPIPPCGVRGGLSPTPTPMKLLPPVASVNSLFYTSQFQTGDIDTTYATGNSFSKLKNWGVGTTLQGELTDNMVLKWIQAYRDLHWDTGMDLDGSPLPILHTSFDMPQHELSEELQLNGKTINERLDYAVGAYYFREAGHLHDYVTFPGALLAIDGPNDLTTRAEALYAHLNFKVTDQFSVTAGARYTREHKLFEGHQSDDNGLAYKGPPPCMPPTAPSPTPGLDCQQYLGFPSAAEPYRYFPPGTQHLDFSNTSPTFGVEYRINPDLMAYASYSKGYKTGSWTTRLSSPHPTYDSSLHFNPEFATSEEIGIKSEWFDKRLRANVAAFHTKYEGIQLNSQQGISPTLVNAGDARIYGFELETEAVVGGGLSMNGAVGYTNAKYLTLGKAPTRDPVTGAITDKGFVADNGLPVVIAGTRDPVTGALVTPCPERTSDPNSTCNLPKTPEWKVYFGPQYVVQLQSAGSLLLNADWTYTSRMANDFGNTQLLYRGATNIANASITYRTPTDQFEFVVGGSNLTAKRYIVTGQNQGGVAVVDASYNAPREWFATFRFIPQFGSGKGK